MSCMISLKINTVFSISNHEILFLMKINFEIKMNLLFEWVSMPVCQKKYEFLYHFTVKHGMLIKISCLSLSSKNIFLF